jgi:HAD superfamily hydrolase (TIGR01549 family)
MPDTPNAYDAIVFDNDGVIVEPTARDVLVDAVVDAFAAFDVTIDRTLAERTVAEDTVPVETAREHGIDPEAFWHHRELTASQAQQAHMRNGGKRLYSDVDVLDEFDVPLGLVSNNQHATIEYVLAHHDLDHFAVAHGRRPTLDGAAKRKPNPHYLETALATLDADHALYVGDSEKDVVAAHRAGIDAAFLRRPHTADTQLSVDPTYDVPDIQTLANQLPHTTDDHNTDTT